MRYSVGAWAPETDPVGSCTVEQAVVTPCRVSYCTGARYWRLHGPLGVYCFALSQTFHDSTLGEPLRSFSFTARRLRAHPVYALKHMHEMIKFG